MDHEAEIENATPPIVTAPAPIDAQVVEELPVRVGGGLCVVGGGGGDSDNSLPTSSAAVPMVAEGNSVLVFDRGDVDRTWRSCLGPGSLIDARDKKNEWCQVLLK